MFIDKIKHIIKSGQSNSVVVCGNVYDIFWDGSDFIPLIQILNKKIEDRIHIVYELNGPIRFINADDKNKLKKAWVAWKTGSTIEQQLRDLARGSANKTDLLNKQFETDLIESIGNPTLALEFLRQMTICSQKELKNQILVTIEAADMLLPAGNGDIASLNDKQLHRIAIVQDWISDPAFINGKNSVIFVAESRSQLHDRISKLPQVLSVDVPPPSAADRGEMLSRKYTGDIQAALDRNIIKSTASLSMYAFQQLLKSWDGTDEAIVAKVEEYIKSQLGEEVVEFKKPTHKLDDCVGFSSLKTFLKTKFIPRMNSEKGEITGAAVAGAIGCHAKGQKILRYDGETICVENIKVGELLMGPNSTPRLVMSLVRGIGEMYKIIPIKGDSFVVNVDHILSLKRTKKNKKDKKAGEIIDVSVKEYLTWSNTRKSLYKLFRTEIDFQSCEKLAIEPYFLGVLLGDGSFQGSPSVTSLDFEILVETIKQSQLFGLTIRIDLQKQTKAVTFYLVGTKNHKNKLTQELRKMNLWNKTSINKFIPKQYLLASRQARLDILAGLLDTDGSYGHCFDFSSTSQQLCDDVVFMSRSLGFAAYKSGPFEKQCQNDGISICWRVCISGELDLIPVRIKRKKAKQRKQKKSVLVTGFKIDPLGINEEYYGFQVNGDNRYLLDDFTVTHNCGKTYIFEAVASELSMPVLVLKSIRSQWFGQTDVIFERLKRVLEALDKVLIFVDEADTQFGGLDENTHETERRLTGKIQAMMSDPKLKGQVYWLLMTARIHRLSPDIRRPGRVGDLIIPVLDPLGADRLEFIKWVLNGIKIKTSNVEIDVVSDESFVATLDKSLPNDYSSASFASLRNNLKYVETFNSHEELVEEINDFIQPAISLTRRYQTLQALVNCTRKSLLPNPKITNEERQQWEIELRELELQGIK